jgi:hypothetical protein
MNVTIEQHLHGVWGNGFYTTSAFSMIEGLGLVQNPKLGR